MSKNKEEDKPEEFKPEIFRERLKKLLIKHKIKTTVEKEIFCEGIEIGFTTLKKYTSDKSKIKNPDIATLFKLANYFGVSLDYLLGYKKINKNK